LNQTPFSQEVEGYTIASAGGSLDTAGWNSLEAQGVDDGDWLASPPLATRLTEFQEDGTTTFDDQTSFDLGEIFQSGAEQDLDFEFLLAGEGVTREGMVDYILGGDYNGDDAVNAADYTVWRNNLGSSERLPNDLTPGSVTTADYDLWKSNFGAAMPGAGGGASSRAVPEPTSFMILAGAIGAATIRRFRKRTQSRRRPATDLRVR